MRNKKIIGIQKEVKTPFGNFRTSEIINTPFGDIMLSPEVQE